jgi:putative tricarboxylic transport membrane protein
MYHCSATRREWLRLGAVAIVCAGPDRLAAAAEPAWKPTRNVEVVVGVGPGGSMDRTARSVEEALWKGHFISRASTVLNKPGGGHAAALSYTVSHRGDGNVIQVVNTPLITNKILGRGSQTYTDATPLATLFFEQQMFAVSKDSTIKSPQDLISRLKTDPSQLSFAVSSGVGTVNEFAALLVAKGAGIDPKRLKAVSFNSASEGVTQTLGNHVDVLVTTPFSIIPFVQSGDLRALAVASDERLAGALKDVPTWKELGIDCVTPGFRVVVGPPDLTAAQIAFWEMALKAITDTPDWKKQVETEFLVPHFRGSADTIAFLRTEADRYTSLYHEMGIT